MIAICPNNQRRELVLQTSGLNGLDYLEVVGAPGCGKQLALTFLKNVRGLALAAENIAITGDTVIHVTSVAPSLDDPFTILVNLDATGDFSPYTLNLVASSMNSDPPAGIDPQLSAATFSFKASCPTPVDCRAAQCCPSNLPKPPDIHYTARDYDGFKQAMLDRIAVLVPGWTERHEADPGITLVEALAYAADRVSYLQDAVNTEAYIGTARSRISMRRHARLIDYQVSEGANARTWVCITAGLDGVAMPKGTQFYPRVPGLPALVNPDEQVLAADQLAASPGPVFESMEDLVLHPEQNEMQFYTWGTDSCCLLAGTTEAFLKGSLSSLDPGQVLIFEEAKGPLSGNAADADPLHRCAVRLISVATTDNSGKPLIDPVDPSTMLTRITWSDEDGLPFPLCLSAMGSDGVPVTNVSVARGNIVATDQGTWIEDESLGVVPPAPLAPISGIGCNCAPSDGARLPRPRFRPVLAEAPLTFAIPYDATQPAVSFLGADPTGAEPQIIVESEDGQTWQAVSDLLSKAAEFAGFIPEMEVDRTAHLRFGDDVYGQSPESGVAFRASYRVGNGAAGNIGCDSLAHVIFKKAGVLGVRNPIAAAGGVDPESMQHIAQVAPFAFQTQMRCVTATDYGTMAATLNDVREAQGTIRWTGSWYSAFVSVDPNVPWSDAVAEEVKTGLDKLRMMGTDLVIEQAIFVGLRIGLEICVAPSFFQGDVYQAVWKLLVTGDACLGTKGLLNAANFQFGQTVYASPIIAAVQSVPGVASVKLTTFERMDQPAPTGAAVPVQITMAAVEIPHCDNDPNHADRGSLNLTMDGGK